VHKKGKNTRIGLLPSAMNECPESERRISGGHVQASESQSPTEAYMGSIAPNLNSKEMAPAANLLRSWKGISAYMALGVRTVQRYEANLGLPVHRPAGGNRCAVWAFSDEIDAWLKRPESERLQGRSTARIVKTSEAKNLTARTNVSPIARTNLSNVPCINPRQKLPLQNYARAKATA